jgi:hypothetical protein
MLVFLRRVPADTTLTEIMDFVEPALKGGLFRPRGEIASASILAMRERMQGAAEYHAVVDIKPDEAALRAIKKLHRQMFKGKRIAVRQYIVRCWKNDRRGDQAQPCPAGKERRVTPTRRRQLQIEVLEPPA